MAKTTGRIRKEQKLMSVEYDQYLAEHIGNVHKGLQWMNDNLPLSKEEKEAIWEAMIMHTHDASKYDKDEYDAYDAYFYGGNRSYKVVQDFNNAWLKHIHKNPHHWQYWVLLEDDPETGMPEKPLMIPLDYIFEMIADWWTFSWRNNNLFEIFGWYAEHRDKQIMHPKTRAIVEQILKKIWDVLIMQAALEGKDTMDIEQQYMKFWMGQEMLEQKDNDKHEDLIEASEITAEDWAKVTVVGTDDPNLDGKVAYTFHGIDIPYAYIEHTGIKGQKWGVRRYQNYDGSLTEAGRERYGRKLVESYEKLGKEYDKNHGFNLSNSAKYKKASIETTKLRHDILKSSKEAMSILNKAKKLDWDEDFDKIDELRKDFKNAAEKTYKSVLEAYGDADVKYMQSSDHKMLDVLVDKANYDDYFDLLWSDDLHHSDLDEEDKHKYGIPEQKKFPMPDKDHVKSAIRFFNYVDPKYEQELADAILERAEEYGLKFGEDITVGDDNKFKKYLPKEES